MTTKSKSSSTAAQFCSSDNETTPQRGVCTFYTRDKTGHEQREASRWYSAVIKAKGWLAAACWLIRRRRKKKKSALTCSVSMCFNLVLVRFNLGHHAFHPEIRQLWAPSSLHQEGREENSRDTVGVDIFLRLDPPTTLPHPAASHLHFLPLLPTRSPRRGERSRSTPWRRPELGSSRRRPLGSSVALGGPWPSPWWCRPSARPGWDDTSRGRERWSEDGGEQGESKGRGGGERTRT